MRHAYIETVLLMLLTAPALPARILPRPQQSPGQKQPSQQQSDQNQPNQNQSDQHQPTQSQSGSSSDSQPNSQSSSSSDSHPNNQSDNQPGSQPDNQNQKPPDSKQPPKSKSPDDNSSDSSSSSSSAPGAADELKHADTTPKYDPFPAEQDVEVGTFYLHKGDTEAAIARFQDAIRLKDNFAKPRLLLAQIYEKRKENATAVKYYKEYLKVYPHAPDAKKVQEKIAHLSAR